MIFFLCPNLRNLSRVLNLSRCSNSLNSASVYFQKHYQQIQSKRKEDCKLNLKWPPCKEGNARFSTVPLKEGGVAVLRILELLPGFWSRMWKFIRPFMKRGTLKPKIEERALLSLFYCLIVHICRKKKQISVQACCDHIVFLYPTQIWYSKHLMFLKD